MSLTELLATTRAAADGFDVDIPEAWLQGRTAYGGLSAALALEAARRTFPDLPPLRSSQISFVGPLSGPVSVRAELLRRGRNAAFVSVDVSSAAGLGLRAMYVFMAAMPSQVDLDDYRAPLVAPPEESGGGERRSGNFFVNNFDWRHALPRPATPMADVSRWVRLEARDGLDPMVEIMAIGDALPPAAMPLMTAPGPISSMTWLVNLLTPAPQTRDGWWLLRATAQFARNGCSSQQMAIWNRDGVPIASGMQSIALFA